MTIYNKLCINCYVASSLQNSSINCNRCTFSILS